MGHRLARAVSEGWPDLPGNAFKVLLRMALVALDQPDKRGRPAELYYGGWEPLADALGHTSLTPAAHTAVRKALKTLTDAGVVKPMNHARQGTRQTYRLRLDDRAVIRAERAFSLTPRGVEKDSPRRGEERPSPREAVADAS